MDTPYPLDTFRQLPTAPPHLLLQDKHICDPILRELEGKKGGGASPAQTIRDLALTRVVKIGRLPSPAGGGSDPGGAQAPGGADQGEKIKQKREEPGQAPPGCHSSQVAELERKRTDNRLLAFLWPCLHKLEFLLLVPGVGVEELCGPRLAVARGLSGFYISPLPPSEARTSAESWLGRA